MVGLVQKQETFYDLFEKQVDMVGQCAHALLDMVTDFARAKDLAHKAESCEQDADEILHEIMRRLNLVFVTPLDREDIHALACALDDIADFANTAADRMVLYQIDAPTEAVQRLTRILAECADLLADAIHGLRNMRKVDKIRGICVEINRLENQGDKVNREALAALFRMDDKPVEALKWREIYHNVETAIDKCEDVADVLESIALKNA